MPEHLYQWLEKTQHLVPGEVHNVILAIFEAALPPLRNDLPPEAAAVVWRYGKDSPEHGPQLQQLAPVLYLATWRDAAQELWLRSSWAQHSL